MKCVLTIAGSDSSAGAGIQSDIKTFQNNSVYGLSVITAVTSQNTLGVQNSYELSAHVILSQLESLFQDFDIKVVKTGMLSSAKVIRIIAKFLRDKNLKLVIDPIILSKNNFRLLSNDGVKALKKYLMPMAYLVTPNLYEAEIISSVKITNTNTIEEAAKKIHSLGVKNVLIKGGHFPFSFALDKGTDVLYNGKYFSIFKSKYINTKHTHGIGCTYSAAITANLSLGKSLKESIILAKEYIIKLLFKSVKIGKGIGSLEQ